MSVSVFGVAIAVILAVDTVSAVRSGARRDILGSYIKRLASLEGIADSFKGGVESVRAASRP